MTSSLESAALIGADGALGIADIPAPPPLPLDERLQQVRDGIAAGRDMGQMGEIVKLFDAILDLRHTDERIVDALRRIVEQAATAIADIRTDATTAILATNNSLTATQEAARAAITELRNDATTAITNEVATRTAAVADLRTEAVDAIATLRADVTTAITGEATTRGNADTTLNTAITNVNANATSAFAADRARLTTIESAITTPNTGILARLTKLEQRLTAAGIT